MRKINLQKVAFSFVSLLILLGLVYVVVNHYQNYTPVQIGEEAPNIQTTTVNGKAFTLASLRGKPILLNFFTPWCPPCIEETPDLIAFANQYGNKVHVVMIDRGDGVGLVQQYVKKYHLPKRIMILLSPYDKWSPRYGVTGQPETFFITSTGIVKKHLIGTLAESQMIDYAKTVGVNVH